MLDFPIQEVQVVQEYVVDQSTIFQAANGVSYQLSEVDLSFSDALAGMCSSETSSGPSRYRPTTNFSKESNHRKLNRR